MQHKQTSAFSEPLGSCNLWQLLLFLPLLGNKDLGMVVYQREGIFWGQLWFYSEDGVKTMPEVGSFPLEFMLRSFGQFGDL